MLASVSAIAVSSASSCAGTVFRWHAESRCISDDGLLSVKAGRQRPRCLPHPGHTPYLVDGSKINLDSSGAFHAKASRRAASSVLTTCSVRLQRDANKEAASNVLLADKYIRDHEQNWNFDPVARRETTTPHPLKFSAKLEICMPAVHLDDTIAILFRKHNFL